LSAILRPLFLSSFLWRFLYLFFRIPKKYFRLIRVAPCRWTNHPHRVLKGFIETKVPPGTPDAVMAQTGTGKKKKNHNG
jgi:hypothetical protein